MLVCSVKILKDYTLEVGFTDGLVKIVDLGDFIKSATNEMTHRYVRKNLFKRVQVKNGYLTWDGNMDISASSLRNWNE